MSPETETSTQKQALGFVLDTLRNLASQFRVTTSTSISLAMEVVELLTRHILHASKSETSAPVRGQMTQALDLLKTWSTTLIDLRDNRLTLTMKDIRELDTHLLSAFVSCGLLDH